MTGGGGEEEAASGEGPERGLLPEPHLQNLGRTHAEERLRWPPASSAGATGPAFTGRVTGQPGEASAAGRRPRLTTREPQTKNLLTGSELRPQRRWRLLPDKMKSWRSSEKDSD